MSGHIAATTSSTLRKQYELLKAQKLNLDLTRGKPSAEQLALSEPMLADTCTQAADGSDCRNYGHLEGLPEARALFGEYLGTPAANTFVLGNSSLEVMHNLLVQMMLRPVPGAEYDWGTVLGEEPAMLCPVPGYDRHHAICEKYGIKMLPVPMNPYGPDIDVVKKFIKSDYVIGMWCIPKYSNPSGVTYTYEICRHLAKLKTESNFRIFWDLAYQVHDLEEETDELPNMLELCREAGHKDRVFIIGSTSKVTFASAGLAMLAASKRNLDWFREGLSVQTIGPDKLNQLRHVRFLKNMDGIRALMARHREILKPKFDAVDEIFTRDLGGRGIASWNKPRGGFFIDLQVKPGCATKAVALADEIGIKLTPAGAPFPYGNDPDDSHIRIGPTHPPLEKVRPAAEGTTLCVRIAAEES